MKYLGKNETYKGYDKVDPSLLEPVEREKYDNKNIGWDVWNAWECSALLDNGVPFVGVLRLSYDSNTKYIIESKSLKLYLNSFNMVKMGKTIDEAAINFENQVKEDLCTSLKDNIGCMLHTRSNVVANPIFGDVTFHTDVLRSNCKVTGQPDWGDLYVYYKDHNKSKFKILDYVMSLRLENHFHEECAELIYNTLMKNLEPKELFVACLYTRRGGIDINPVRASHEKLIYKFANNLITLPFLQQKSFRS